MLLRMVVTVLFFGTVLEVAADSLLSRHLKSYKKYRVLTLSLQLRSSTYLLPYALNLGKMNS